MSDNKLRGSTTVSLHTHYANRAIKGRIEKEGVNGIPSLFQFNSQSNLIFKSCQLDDPLAWWIVVKIENKLEKIESELTTYGQIIQDALNINRDRITIESTFSEKPEQHVVNVSNYGFKMLDMITHFDRVCCDCFGAIHRCRISQKEGVAMMNQIAQTLRKAMSTCNGYSYTGVTRKDLTEKNKRAVSAIKRLVKTRLIDVSHFNSMDDICDYFAAYQPETKYGPNVITD